MLSEEKWGKCNKLTRSSTPLFLLVTRKCQTWNRVRWITKSSDKDSNWRMRSRSDMPVKTWQLISKSTSKASLTKCRIALSRIFLIFRTKPESVVSFWMPFSNRGPETSTSFMESTACSHFWWCLSSTKCSAFFFQALVLDQQTMSQKDEPWTRIEETRKQKPILWTKKGVNF